MNYVKAGIFFFICWLFQTTLMWRIWPFGAAPSLLFCAVICFAWLYRSNYFLVYAVCFGLLLDLQSSQIFGVQALALVLCSVPALLLRLYFHPERTLAAMLAALIGTPVYLFTVWGAHRLFGTAIDISLVIPDLPQLGISQTLICLILHISFVRTIIKDKKDRRYVGGVM